MRGEGRQEQEPGVSITVSAVRVVGARTSGSTLLCSALHICWR